MSRLQAHQSRGSVAVVTEWLPRIRAYLARQEAARFTGRVQLTINFNQGGITKVVAVQQVELNLRREPSPEEDVR